MNKIIIISLVISFAICSKSWAEDLKIISIGKLTMTSQYTNNNRFELPIEVTPTYETYIEVTCALKNTDNEVVKISSTLFDIGEKYKNIIYYDIYEEVNKVSCTLIKG